MSDEVYESFYNILSNRKKQKKEVMIDGYAGFILLDKNGNPKVAMHVQKVVQRLCEKYNEENIIPLPRITPHVARHTFCSNMASAGMSPKMLQYIMGHSEIGVTLNVYTHVQAEDTTETYRNIINNKQYSIYPLSRTAELSVPDVDSIEDTEPMDEQETA